MADFLKMYSLFRMKVVGMRHEVSKQMWRLCTVDQMHPTTSRCQPWENCMNWGSNCSSTLQCYLFVNCKGFSSSDEIIAETEDLYDKSVCKKSINMLAKR